VLENRAAALPWWLPKCAAWPSAAQKAAKEITQLIQESSQRVESGTQLVADAGKTIQAVRREIEHVTTMVGQIHTATAEQFGDIVTVNTAISQLGESTQCNAALVEQAASAAASLKEQARSLTALTQSFKLPEAGVSQLPNQLA